jgi:predicted ATPase
MMLKAAADPRLGDPIRPGHASRQRRRTYDLVMELLERGHFLRTLRDCPPGRVALVSGEAGIGKTALLSALCATTNMRVLWGSCDALRTPRPLGPLRDMARLTVAVVEDAHWADEATLDLLVYAARRMSLTSSLLAVTYRDDEVVPGHPLLGVLGALAADRTVLRIRLDWAILTAPPRRPRRRGLALYR